MSAAASATASSATMAAARGPCMCAECQTVRARQPRPSSNMFLLNMATPPQPSMRKQVKPVATAPRRPQKKSKPAVAELDLDQQCGVWRPQKEAKPCRRCLNCKLHGNAAKRAVSGRSAPFDVLFALQEQEKVEKRQLKQKKNYKKKKNNKGRKKKKDDDDDYYQYLQERERERDRGVAEAEEEEEEDSDSSSGWAVEYPMQAPALLLSEYGGFVQRKSLDLFSLVQLRTPVPDGVFPMDAENTTRKRRKMSE